MQALVVPDPVLTQVNRILFRFLWRKKDCNRKAFEKVKTVVCGALENGGLNMVDLKQMQAAFLLQWVGRLFQAQALDKWSHVPKKRIALNKTYSHNNRHHHSAVFDMYPSSL